MVFFRDSQKKMYQAPPCARTNSRPSGYRDAGQMTFPLWLPKKGLCDVVVIRRKSQRGPDGLPVASDKMVVAQKGEGDYFGETALVRKGTKRTAYVKAQT